MIRSVLAVIAGYLLFAASAVALLAITGRDAHGEAPAWFIVASTLYGIVRRGGRLRRRAIG